MVLWQLLSERYRLTVNMVLMDTIDITSPRHQCDQPSVTFDKFYGHFSVLQLSLSMDDRAVPTILSHIWNHYSL